MVPGRQRRRVRQALNVVARNTAIGREIDRLRHLIVLVVPADEQRLAIRQVEIEPGDVRVQLRRGASVETKTARVQAVAGCRVVCRVTSSSSGEEIKRSRIDAGV